MAFAMKSYAVLRWPPDLLNGDRVPENTSGTSLSPEAEVCRIHGEPKGAVKACFGELLGVYRVFDLEDATGFVQEVTIR